MLKILEIIIEIFINIPRYTILAVFVLIVPFVIIHITRFFYNLIKSKHNQNISLVFVIIIFFVTGINAIFILNSNSYIVEILALFYILIIGPIFSPSIYRKIPFIGDHLAAGLQLKSFYYSNIQIIKELYYDYNLFKKNSYNNTKYTDFFENEKDILSSIRLGKDDSIFWKVMICYMAIKMAGQFLRLIVELISSPSIFNITFAFVALIATIYFGYCYYYFGFLWIPKKIFPYINKFILFIFKHLSRLAAMIMQ